MRVKNFIDPSHVYRPDIGDLCSKSNKEHFRNFENGPLQERIKKTYKEMHTYQTVELVRKKHAQWGRMERTRMSIMKALAEMDLMVDESDPDVDFPNSFHAYQTAEAIRQAHPDKDWLQLVGLIHDLGKIMARWGEPQWCVVGDTFPVGCAFQKSIVYRDSTFQDNPDSHDARYNTLCGIYEPNCGLDKVSMSWGHDEYMYRVLKFNECTIPEEGFYIVRYHSFYPWHTAGDYGHLCNEQDRAMLPWVREFNKFDLYTKSEDLPNVEELKPYYAALVEKYCPESLRW
ncbi:unnamed protein product [Lampetra planeri]